MSRKVLILLILILFSLYSVAHPEDKSTSDLSKLKKGGKIISPPGAFISGKAGFSREFKTFLFRLGTFLKQNNKLLLEIRGHSDSQGSRKVKERISLLRAEEVKNILIKESGVSGDRIISKGFSDRFPIAENNSFSGRNKNRRVEILLGENKNSVGEITFIRKNVFTKSPQATDFSRAEIYDALFNLYKLNTEKKSGANIKLSDESLLNIGPESLMVIYEMLEDNNARKGSQDSKKIKLLTGFLRTKLDKLRKSVNIDTPQCSITSESKVILIDISKEKKSAVSVFDGKSEIKAMDKVVDVKAGFGTYVKEGTPPAKPEPLPPAPDLVSPENNKRFTNENQEEKEIPVIFEWKSGENSAHIQISRDRKFTKIVRDEKISGNTITVSLGNGDYFWRVAGINENGIEGFTSISGFFVRIKKAGLPITVTPEAKNTPIDAHGSTTYVKNRSILISGKTIPGAEIFISYEAVIVDQEGRFSKEISLNWGWNIIKVTASHPDYRSRDQWVSICYFKKLYK